VDSSISSISGIKILVAPQPGSGERHQTLVIVELPAQERLSRLVQVIEDAQTVHRSEILPGVDFSLLGKLKPDTTPEAIMEALRNAKLLDE
jgi:hypothetical protein